MISSASFCPRKKMRSSTCTTKFHGGHIVIMDDHPDRRFQLIFRHNVRDNFRDGLDALVHFANCSNSAPVRTTSAAARFSAWCCGLNDIGMVITRGCCANQASAICWGVVPLSLAIDCSILLPLMVLCFTGE